MKELEYALEFEADLTCFGPKPDLHPSIECLMESLRTDYEFWHRNDSWKGNPVRVVKACSWLNEAELHIHVPIYETEQTIILLRLFVTRLATEVAS